jgi:hypothetical protein
LLDVCLPTFCLRQTFGRKTKLTKSRPYRQFLYEKYFIGKTDNYQPIRQFLK